MASSPAKVEARRPSRQDAAVAEKVSAAVGRIRNLELIVGLAGLLVGFLVYGQVMAAIDVRWPMPEVLRQLALFVFLAAAGTWAYLHIYRPLRYGINPYYAVQVVEENTAGSRNGLLNWLDIQATPEGNAARGLVGQRAAKEAGKVDLERAINGDAATWVSAAAGLLFLFAFILALLLGPRNFLQSLHRVFFPGTFALPTLAATEITILRPEGGDGTILVGQAATITVRLDGRIPKATDTDAAKVRFRHSDAEPWRERPLTQREDDNTWEVVIPSTEVENGIEYQVTAGNATTPTHRIQVIAAPLIEDFRATYRFRHYTGRTFEVRREREIDSLRGTEVELLVKTNRVLAADTARLEMEVPSGRRMIPATILPDNPQAFSVKFVLEESGTYRLHFASTRKDAYIDAVSYPLVSRPDNLPEVELTHPARDVQLPANGLLPLEGWASDDIGLQRLTLRMRIVDGPMLRPQLYREMDTFRQKHGTYPTHLRYKDALDLTKLREEKGPAHTPVVGSKIEYWLEAMDACDLPGPARTVESKHYRIEVVEADPDGKGQMEQRQQAEKDKAAHEKKQDEANAAEDAARKDENDRREQDPSQMGGNMQGQGANNMGGMNNPDPMNPMQGGMGEQNPEDKQALNDAERIKDALEKKGQENKQPGQGKDDKKEQGGESKEGGEGKEDKNQPGEKKEGAGEKKDQAGQGKEQGRQGNMGEKKPGEGKEGGEPGMMGENQPEGKEGAEPGMGAQQNGENKPGRQGGANKPGQGRERPEGMQNPAEQREGNPGENGAQGKEGNPQGGPAGEQKPQPQNPNQPAGEGKPGGEKADPNGQPMGKQEPGAGENKPAEEGNSMAEGKTQGATGKPGANPRDLKDPREARPEDVEALKNQAAQPGKAGAEAAGKELERIQKEANDPKVREAARQALDEMKNMGNAGQKPAENKQGGEPGMGMGGENPPQGAAERKPGQGEGMPGGGEAKPQEGMGQQMGEKAEIKDGRQGMGGMGGMPMPGENAPQGKEMGGQPAGGQPGMGVDPNQGNQVGMGQGAGPNENKQPEKALPAPPTELQLQKFKDAVTPDILKDLRMSPEDFERFLKKYEQMAKRPGNQRETVPGTQAGTGNLPALGGTRPTGSTGPAGPTGPGTIQRPMAPPGYTEAYPEFLRKLALPPE